MNIALHTINSMFYDHPDSKRRHAISASKLAKGDATWATKKRLLGWDLDTVSMTIHLPPHRLEHLQTSLQELFHKHRTSLRTWQKLLGNLRSMVPALIGSKYLFSILQTPLQQPQCHRIRITSILRYALCQWLQLATAINHTPAPIRTLVPTAPCAIGALDASAHGMGGFWIPSQLSSTSTPIIWRHPFQPNITSKLISAMSTAGVISINELERAAMIQAYHIALQTMPPTAHGTFLCATDNTAAHAWVSRGSTTTIQAPAYLLQMLATLARTSHCSFDSVFTAGSTNTLADFCSRSFDIDDATFLAHVNERWPMQTSWRLVHPTNDTKSQWTSALSNRTVVPVSALTDPTPMTVCGEYGVPSVTHSTRMSSSLPRPPHSIATTLCSSIPSW
jgi:hypothetical protein